MQPSSPSGLKTIPQLQWGSHLAHFYTAGEELRDVLVPYFKAGLENNEQCLWVTGDGFNAEQARSALRAAIPDLDRRERGKQIEIANGGDWYSASERLRPDELVNGLLQSEQDALGRGFAGLRTSGNCAWVSHDQWADFLDYERLVQKSVRGRRLICFCSYCTDQLRDGVHWDVLERHDMALPHARPARRDLSNGAPIESTEKRLFDLAMTASQMGTWRYTLADNVCVYDENAQRLYGLTEARFLHDEEGVKSKFHPDDLELMWARVTKALDPQGDGRYDVDYRVRQLDGSWRWLSAWGLVEFEGDGREKNPVAITGASKDLTAQKRAEEAERLMRDELIHRVKNTLATVQAVAGLTLRAATDLPSASQALERRIQSMAQAHDLLTSRAWTAANLMDVVMRSVGPFTPAQIRISGPAIDVSAQHVLALSLAIHELATNAAKYGALSRPEGRVDLGWQVQDGTLSLHWEESGGPPVARPARKGFGSRLLENLVFRDRGGDTVLTYDPQGVRCHMTVPL
jgi:two-component sensor histidine kinase/PAS domain-containing protein